MRGRLVSWSYWFAGGEGDAIKYMLRCGCDSGAGVRVVYERHDGDKGLLIVFTSYRL